MEKQVSAAKRKGLEQRIFYHGPAEKAKETKELVKELLQRRIIEFKPVLYLKNRGQREKIENTDFNFEAKVWVGNDGYPGSSNHQIQISPNDSNYKIQYLRIPKQGENINLDFVNLSEGKVALSYKGYNIFIFCRTLGFKE